MRNGLAWWDLIWFAILLLTPSRTGLRAVLGGEGVEVGQQARSADSFWRSAVSRSSDRCALALP